MSSSNNNITKVNNFTSIQTVLDKLLTPLSYQFGFEIYKLTVQWEHIVGKHLASLSVPINIYPLGSRYIRRSGNHSSALIIEIVNPGFALELQAAEGTIVSRVNNYFGYKIIDRIKTKIRAARR